MYPEKLVSLGWCVAKYNPSKDKGGHGPNLMIISPSDTQEGVHQPAESVTIWSDGAVVALRDFLIELFPLPSPPEVGK